MKVRVTSRSRLSLTELSLGCSQLGNLYRAISDDEAAATVERAWKLGIRYFDTAPHYGLGLSERRLGAALAGRSREEYVVSTKVGRRLEPAEPPYGRDDEGFDVPAMQRRVWDFSRDGVLRSLEDSLVRLGLDRVDVVFLHDPDDHWPDAIDHAYPALEELRAQGVVSSIGAGMNQSQMLADLVRHTDIDLVMVAGRLTLLDQDAFDDLVPLCVERTVGIVAAGVFNSGILAADAPSSNARFNYDPASAPVIERAQHLGDICRIHGVSLPAAAIAYPLTNPGVVSVCLGARSPEQVARNVEHYARGVPASLWEALSSAGLLPDGPPDR